MTVSAYSKNAHCTTYRQLFLCGVPKRIYGYSQPCFFGAVFSQSRLNPVVLKKTTRILYLTYLVWTKPWVSCSFTGNPHCHHLLGRALRPERGEVLSGVVTSGSCGHVHVIPQEHQPPPVQAWTTAPAPSPQLWLPAHSQLTPDKCTSILHSTLWHSRHPPGSRQIPERQFCCPVTLTQCCIESGDSSATVIWEGVWPASL